MVVFGESKGREGRTLVFIEGSRMGCFFVRRGLQNAWKPTPLSLETFPAQDRCSAVTVPSSFSQIFIWRWFKKSKRRHPTNTLLVKGNNEEVIAAPGAMNQPPIFS